MGQSLRVLRKRIRDVVINTQCAELDIVRIKLIRERKGPAGFQPAEV
jgi:hypothetical protein